MDADPMSLDLPTINLDSPQEEHDHEEEIVETTPPKPPKPDDLSQLFDGVQEQQDLLTQDPKPSQVTITASSLSSNEDGDFQSGFETGVALGNKYSQYLYWVGIALVLLMIALLVINYFLPISDTNHMILHLVSCTTIIATLGYYGYISINN